VDPSLVKTIHAEDYRSGREAASVGHPYYLHLSDLSLALAEAAQGRSGDWLDYGSGASPYRSLFPSCRYTRADIAGDNLDYVIVPGVPLPAPDASFDGILSTQVLEHISEPAAYLADCRRLLRPGGALLLTTHGTWKEHGVPYDYRRWTTYGLEMELEQAGFAVERMARLTCGPRAVLMLLYGPKFESGFWGKGVVGSSLALCFNWIVRNKKGVHRLSDRVHGHLRVVWDRPEPFYLALLAIARKPAARKPGDA
jgi:SAM-dependent methyltransferase